MARRQNSPQWEAFETVRDRFFGRGQTGGSGGAPDVDEIEAMEQAALEQMGLSGGGDRNSIFFGEIGPDTPVRTGGFGGFPGAASTVGAQLRHFYTVSDAYITELQAIMFAGGFYGSGTQIEDINWGTHDDDSFAAWARVVEQAAMRGAAGQETSILDVLKEAAIAAGVDEDSISKLGVQPTGFGPDDIPMEEEGEVISREGDVITVGLDDPNALRSTIDRVAHATVGRKANADEQRMFISLIHNLQRQGQIAAQTAEPGIAFAGISAQDALAASSDPAAAMALEESLPDPEDAYVEYADPDAQASAEAFLRQQNPAEAGAHDIAIQMANFMDILEGQVQFPRLTF